MMTGAPIGVWIFVIAVAALLAVHGAVMPQSGGGKVFFAIFQPTMLFLALIFFPRMLGA